MAAADPYTSTSPIGLIGGREVFEFVDGDLVPDDIQELVTMSLFTWRRARDDDFVPEGESRQGWAGDAEFGSRLWLLNYRPLTDESLIDARSYVLEALGWLVDDGILASVDATTERAERGIYADIKIQRPGKPGERLRYSYLTEGKP